MSNLSAALLTAKRYADGGDTTDDDAWANVPRTSEGIPRIAITPQPKQNQQLPPAPTPESVGPDPAAKAVAQTVAPNIYKAAIQAPAPPPDVAAAPPGKIPSQEDPTIPAAIEAAGFVPGPETWGAKMAAGFLPAFAKMFGEGAAKDVFTDLAPEEVGAAKKIGEQGGSSPGGTYTGFSDGQDRYIKIAKSEDHAKNEKLASMLYKEAGIPGADVELTRLGDQPAISSPIIPGKQLGQSDIHPDDYKLLPGLQKGLPVDQWLANYDVLGLDHDNIIMGKDNTPHRIDFGGALLYRAQGKPKTWWGSDVKEFESMHDPDVNPNAANAFTKPGEDGLNDDFRRSTAERIAAISDDRIRELVNQYGPGAVKTKQELAADLISRRDQVADYYGVKPTQAPPPGSQRAPYGYIDPPSDAQAMLHNNTWNNKDGSFHSYDTAGIAKSMYKMATAGGQVHVDEIYKHLPHDIQPDVNGTLDYLIKQHGFDPWGDMPSLDRVPFEDAGNNEPLTDEEWNNLVKDLQSPEHQAALSQVKDPQVKSTPSVSLAQSAEKITTLMQLNKTHSAYQLVQALKDTTNQQVLYGDKVTPKQTGNIVKLINSKDAGQLALAMSKLTSDQQSKLNTWMHQSTMDKIGDALFDLANKMKLSDDPDQYEKDLEDYYQAQEEQASNQYELGQGIEKNPVSGKKFISQSYTDALKPLNWQTYKPKYAVGFTPLDIPNAEWDEILSQGYNPNLKLFHGSSKTGKWPNELADPQVYKKGTIEKGFFMFGDPGLHRTYGEPLPPAMARATKAAHVDWGDVVDTSWHGVANYSPRHMHNLIEAAREAGNDVIVVDGIYDIGSGGEPQTQYIFLKTELLRLPEAKFDPKMLHKAIPLAGVVGGTTFTYGMLPGEESSKGKMARGGKVRKFTMPLEKGSSPGTVSKNISEFHTGPTYAHTAAKFGKERANKQAIAAALSEARRSGKKKAFGGPNLSMENMVVRGASYGLRHEGLINSSVPGRTDKLPMNVKSGSYVLPADIPSALGQGNSKAGGQILNKMFSSGPYGLGTMKSSGRSGAPHMNFMRPPKMNTTFAKGGEADTDGDEHVPIVAAGGEYIIHPEVVRDIGHGDIKKGHKVLDKFVIDVRKKHVKTLEKLPGPKK